MTTLAVPGVPAVNRRPLSTHGLPKPPRVTSPDLTHRFSALGSPSQQTISGSTLPRSPGPMSPPMSARSFGTFIDSAPSTPAYSPRMDYEWDSSTRDSSTLVLLRPMSSSSEPSSPTEPAWDMVKPMESSQQYSGPLPTNHKGPLSVRKDPFGGTRLASPPIKKPKSAHKPRPLHPIEVPDLSRRDTEEVHKEEGDEVKALIDNPVGNSAAPLGKFASRMKSMLRRRSTNDKKKEKKEKDYYDPGEALHWTEM